MAVQLPLGAQMLNAGFENWTDCAPDDWATSDVCGFLTPVTKTTAAHSGSFAARGEVISFAGQKVNPMVQSGPTGEGFAIAERFSSVQGFHTFAPVGGDRIAVNVVVYKDGNVVGQGAVALSTPAAAYTEFTTPINYTTADVPDTAIIQISIVGPVLGSDYHLGSVMQLDDLAFGSGSGGGSPSLGIQLLGGSVTVTWPADATGHSLQTTPVLNPPQWAAVPGLGNAHSHTFVPTSQAFFRLVKP